MLHKIANLMLQFVMFSFVRVGRRRGAPALEEATAAAPAPVFNFAAPAVAATTAAPEDEKEEKKEKEKEQTTQAAEQPEKVEKKEEKEEEEEKEEKEEEQKPSDEDKKETAKVDFGKTPENVRSPERARSFSTAWR